MQVLEIIFITLQNRTAVDPYGISVCPDEIFRIGRDGQHMKIAIFNGFQITRADSRSLVQFIQGQT